MRRQSGFRGTHHLGRFEISFTNLLIKLARLWLLEIGVLTLTGGLIGLASAVGLTRAIVALAPDDVPRLGEIAVSPTVVAFTFLVVTVTALVCGLMPMRHASRTGLTDALGDGARGTAGRHSIRMRSGLPVAQMALAVVMLVAAGLVVRSFSNLRTIDLGFNPANVLSLRVEQAFVALTRGISIRGMDDLEAAQAILDQLPEIGDPRTATIPEAGLAQVQLELGKAAA